MIQQHQPVRAPEASGAEGANGQAASTVCSAQKEFETQRAQLALAGYSLHAVEGGNGAASYLVSRWAMTRPLVDLHAVRQFMRQVGVGQ